ncbi:MAG TPA: cytochrome c3 family protein [Bryobacteraceae bacterium]|nr:cytochrome c3 family protein [Candidatus Sulfotelmatobacter sp.]HXP83836.1 cytochrome c3 family protein [Bryobacteraceae bacterium]
MKLATAVLFVLSLTGAAGAAGIDCLSCHAEKASAKKSVHGALACADCHAAIRAFPHPDKVAPVNCASCHAGNASALAQSVHAGAGGPTCLNCHGDPHSILPAKDSQSTTYPANLPRTCGSCHGNAQLAKQLGLQEVYSLYMDSIHGFALTRDGLLVAASCSSCHGSHDILSSKDPMSKTNHVNVPQTCGTCHAGPLRDYTSSIHGQMLQAAPEEAPVCTNCHTAHQIAKVGTAEWQMKTTATCGGCHKDEYATYRDTFHAQVSALGYQQTARCWDCHGHHDILPPSDPKSTVASGQLVSTCGKCHAGASASFVKYDPHADSHDAVHYPALHYSAVFMNLLLASVLGFFALHTLAWFIRSHSGGNAGTKPKESPPE